MQWVQPNLRGERPLLRFGWTRCNSLTLCSAQSLSVCKGHPTSPKAGPMPSLHPPHSPQEAPLPGPQGAVVMGMLGLLSCLLSNRTSRSVTMETASTQPSAMGTGFPALSEDFPFCHMGGASLHSLSQEPPGAWLFQWQVTASALLGKVPKLTGTFCSQGW